MDKTKLVYEPLDLGEYDESFAGQTVNVLRNPTYGFRRDYLMAGGAEWLPLAAIVLGVEDAQKAMEDYPYEIWVWLLIGMSPNGTTNRLPFVVQLWDRYAEERIKKRASRLPL